jgi:hypothetical protein
VELTALRVDAVHPIHNRFGRLGAQGFRAVCMTAWQRSAIFNSA